jgi:hypothetical protein
MYGQKDVTFNFVKVRQPLLDKIITTSADPEVFWPLADLKTFSFPNRSMVVVI